MQWGRSPSKETSTQVPLWYVRHFTIAAQQFRYVVCMCLLVLAGCVQIDRTTSLSITGVLLDANGKGIPGAQVWAYFSMGSGLLSSPPNKAFGPAITDSDGQFVLPMEEVAMVRTGTIFDGRTTPSLLVFHRDIGAFGIVSLKEQKDLGFKRIVWNNPPANPSAREVSFRIMSELPEKDQAVVRRYLGRQ